VSVQREDGQPAQVTVRRGDESWTVQGDDPESLNQLPADLRPAIAKLLHSSDGAGLPGATHGVLALQDDELRARIEAMERQMEALEQRLLESTQTSTAEDSAQ
jgi:hypothetical protein